MLMICLAVGYCEVMAGESGGLGNCALFKCMVCPHELCNSERMQSFYTLWDALLKLVLTVLRLSIIDSTQAAA